MSYQGNQTRGRPRKYHTEEERKEAFRTSYAKYSQTEHGRAARRLAQDRWRENLRRRRLEEKNGTTDQV